MSHSQAFVENPLGGYCGGVQNVKCPPRSKAEWALITPTRPEDRCMTIPAPAPSALGTCSVYRYYDRLGLLIYVGITDGGMRRNREHNKHAVWWEYVARQEVEHYATRIAARAREKALIQQHRPPFNTQHNVDGQHLREAYLAVMNAGLGSEDPAQLWQRLNRHLPLSFLEGSDQRALRTQPDHVALAALLHASHKKFPPLYAGNARLTAVTGIEVCPPVTVLRLGKAISHPGPWFGRIKMQTKPLGFRLTSVLLEEQVDTDPFQREAS